MIFSKIIKSKKGFTLIELLVVIGILAVLLAITLIAINPARQFAQANNTKRRSDVNAILNAINQYMSDNRGIVPQAGAAIPIGATPIQIADTGVNLCVDIVPIYIAALPRDPKVSNGAAVASPCPATYATGYNVSQGGDNRITVQVQAANQELGEAISVTR